MEHALIIGGDRSAIDTLETRLWETGYRSILAVDEMSKAELVAQHCPPKLIVIVPGPSLAAGTEPLRDLSERTGAPIIVATTDPDAALDCLGPGARLEGPFPANALARAEAVARHPSHVMATAA